MVKKKPTLKLNLDGLKKLFKYTRVFFIVLVLGSYATAVFLVMDALQAPSDEAYREEKLKSSVRVKFDEVTIEKIEKLHHSNQKGSSANLPKGVRINPFAE